MELLTAITVGLLFAVGIFQMLRRNIIRSTIGLVILANAVNLFLLSTGAYDGMAAAYTTSTGQRSSRALSGGSSTSCLGRFSWAAGEAPSLRSACAAKLA